MTTLTAITDSDATLVELSRRNDRGAFERIVSRYQTLVCSVALSAVGDVASSEDIAQETFLTAWRQIAELREPAKLRAWLCGIARNLAANSLRRRRMTQEIDPSIESSGPSPFEHASGREEQAILARSLEKLPFIYRRPLILFYRQDQSVNDVAEAMGLPEATVRQRLSRGRKLLQSEVTSLLENALRQSAPKRAFTLGVLAALPVMATSAKAAAISSAAAKGSLVAKTAGAVGLFGALLGPAVGLLGGYAGVRASLDDARTPNLRRLVMRRVRRSIVWALICNLGLFLYIYFASIHSNWRDHPRLMVAAGIGLPLIYAAWLLVMIVRFNRDYRSLGARERQLHPEAFKADPAGSRDYRSRLTLLGLPLVCIRAGSAGGEKSPPAIGWIAAGPRAYGILFAAGGLAVSGGVAWGGISVGLISMGGVSVGLLCIGGLAIGAMAVGGAAIGLLAAGGLATGWIISVGGVAMAHGFAVGGVAMAAHANDEAAQEFLRRYPWIDMTRPIYRNVAVLLTWLPLLLLFFLPRRKRMGG